MRSWSSDYERTLARAARRGLRPRAAHGALGRAARVRAATPPGTSSSSWRRRRRGTTDVRTAVVGHLEWTEFLPVERAAAPGRDRRDARVLPGAGRRRRRGRRAARAAGRRLHLLHRAWATTSTARRVERRLAELGVRVRGGAARGEPTRRAFVYLDADGERTITTIGERIQPERADDLPWDDLARRGRRVLRRRRRRTRCAPRAPRASVVATARIAALLAQRRRAARRRGRVSGRDAGERHRPIEPPPRLVVDDRRARRGGELDGRRGTHRQLGGRAASRTRSRDAYGAGDSFAAGLAFALGDGRDVGRRARARRALRRDVHDGPRTVRATACARRPLGVPRHTRAERVVEAGDAGRDPAIAIEQAKGDCKRG